MTNFDRNWQVCAARARENARADESAPFGFASRVLSAARNSLERPVSMEEVWQRLTWRSLAVVASVLVICAAIELPHFSSRTTMKPGIENTVAQLVWTL